VRSSPITTDAIVLSRNGTTTRYRDHASHARNNTARTPATSGPSPSPHCSHFRGCGIHGRVRRPCFCRHRSGAAYGEAFMATDTARRRGSTAPLRSWNGRRASRPRDGALARSWRPHGGWCRFSRRACDRQPWRLPGPELSASSVTDGESCAASPGRLRQAPSVRCARELRPGPMTNALTRVGSGDSVRLFARSFPRRSAAGYGPAVPVAAVQLKVVIADVAANLSRWAMSPGARGGLYLHER
jgi:hypothetical protein